MFHQTDTLRSESPLALIIEAIIGLSPRMPNLAGGSAGRGAVFRWLTIRRNPLKVGDIRFVNRLGGTGRRDSPRSLVAGPGSGPWAGIYPHPAAIRDPTWNPTIVCTFPDCQVSYNSSKSPTSCGDPSNGGLSMKIGAPLRRDRVVLRGCTRSRTWEPGTVLCEHRDGRRWLLGAHRAPYPPRSRLLVRPSSPATHQPRSGSPASVTCHDPYRGSVRSMHKSIRGV